MTDITDERLAVMLEAIAPPVGMVMLQGADLEAVRSVLSQLLAVRPALRTIRSSIPGYLKKEMTAEEFALVVIGEADNKVINAAMGKADAT